MLRKYIIDGNNLMGKIPKLRGLNKQEQRERLTFILERYFYNKKVKVSLHFDGYPNTAIKAMGIKITYSESRIADDKIRDEISYAKNPRLITLVSSDHALMDFAKKNSCTIISSEEFNREMNRPKDIDDEEKRIKEMNNDEFKKLFGIE
jgi:predicted RNA-binding protein with PIN domain